jgi:hypothetical protein
MNSAEVRAKDPSGSASIRKGHTKVEVIPLWGVDRADEGHATISRRLHVTPLRRDPVDASTSGGSARFRTNLSSSKTCPPEEFLFVSDVEAAPDDVVAVRRVEMAS